MLGIPGINPHGSSRSSKETRQFVACCGREETPKRSTSLASSTRRTKGRQEEKKIASSLLSFNFVHRRHRDLVVGVGRIIGSMLRVGSMLGVWGMLGVWSMARCVAALHIRLAGCTRAMRQSLALWCTASTILELVYSAGSVTTATDTGGPIAVAKGDLAIIAFDLSSLKPDHGSPGELDGEVVRVFSRRAGDARSVAPPVLALIATVTAARGATARRVAALVGLAQGLGGEWHRCTSIEIILVPHGIQVSVAFEAHATGTQGSCAHTTPAAHAEATDRKRDVKLLIVVVVVIVVFIIIIYYVVPRPGSSGAALAIHGLG